MRTSRDGERFPVCLCGAFSRVAFTLYFKKKSLADRVCLWLCLPRSASGLRLRRTRRNDQRRNYPAFTNPALDSLSRHASLYRIWTRHGQDTTDGTSKQSNTPLPLHGSSRVFLCSPAPGCPESQPELRATPRSVNACKYLRAVARSSAQRPGTAGCTKAL